MAFTLKTTSITNKPENKSKETDRVPSSSSSSLSSGSPEPSSSTTTTSCPRISHFVLTVVVVILALASALFETTTLHGVRDDIYQHRQDVPISSREVIATNKSAVVYWPESLIHDGTLQWDPTVYRPWLDTGLPKERQPPAMILLTSFGWNQPNQEDGRNLGRSLRETELFEGIINHPWFHPTLWDDILGDGWDELVSGGNVMSSLSSSSSFLRSDVRYYVFSDVQQCPDMNYPHYGGGIRANVDRRWNRSDKYYIHYGFQYESVFRHPLFVDDRYNTTAIHFHCRGTGLPDVTAGHNRFNGSDANLPLSVATLSSLISNVNHAMDQGLIPGAPKPCHLSPAQIEDIMSCVAERKRKLYLVYAGNYRSGQNRAFNGRFGGARGSYEPFNDNERIFITRYFLDEFNQSVLSNYTYEEAMQDTVFALAPRGDNKFSYRFAELLSGGAIPVVHADDWVWPFRPELVDWSECAVNLPEKDAGEFTIKYLDTISEEQRCKMRQACYGIYQKYIENTVGTIDGLVGGLEKIATGVGPLPLFGVRCDTFTEDPTECNLLRR